MAHSIGMLCPTNYAQTLELGNNSGGFLIHSKRARETNMKPLQVPTRPIFYAV
jgi:hypothetical protein